MFAMNLKSNAGFHRMAEVWRKDIMGSWLSDGSDLTLSAQSEQLAGHCQRHNVQNRLFIVY